MVLPKNIADVKSCCPLISNTSSSTSSHIGASNVLLKYMEGGARSSGTNHDSIPSVRYPMTQLCLLR